MPTLGTPTAEETRSPEQIARDIRQTFLELPDTPIGLVEAITGAIRDAYNRGALAGMALTKRP